MGKNIPVTPLLEREENFSFLSDWNILAVLPPVPVFLIQMFTPVPVRGPLCSDDLFEVFSALPHLLAVEFSS